MTEAYVNVDIDVDAGVTSAAANEIADVDAVSVVHVVIGENHIIA